MSKFSEYKFDTISDLLWLIINSSLFLFLYLQNTSYPWFKYCFTFEFPCLYNNLVNSSLFNKSFLKYIIFLSSGIIIYSNFLLYEFSFSVFCIKLHPNKVNSSLVSISSTSFLESILWLFISSYSFGVKTNFTPNIWSLGLKISKYPLTIFPTWTNPKLIPLPLIIVGLPKYKVVWIILFPVEVSIVISEFISFSLFLIILFQYFSLSFHKYNSLYVKIFVKSTASEYFFNKLSTLGSKTNFKNLVLFPGIISCNNNEGIILLSLDLIELIVTGSSIVLCENKYIVWIKPGKPGMNFASDWCILK